MSKKDAGPEPEQQTKPEPEPEQQTEPDEEAGHTVITDGDADLPVPPLEPPVPFLESVDPPEEQLRDVVMPFTGDDNEGKGSN